VSRLAITPLRLAAAFVIFGVAAVAGLWVATYQVQEPYVGPVPKTPGIIYYLPSYTSPAWTTPAAVVIAVAAVGAAFFILRRR
jgi:hypothetical protein